MRLEKCVTITSDGRIKDIKFKNKKYQCENFCLRSYFQFQPNSRKSLHVKDYGFTKENRKVGKWVIFGNKRIVYFI